MLRPLTLGLILLLFVDFASMLCGGEPMKNRPIELNVDLTEAPRKLLRSRLVIPAKPGPLTLCYPRWIPGEHAPAGPIADLAGLKFRSGGKPLAWERDDVDLFSFHCTVPDGEDSVEILLEYLAPSHKEGGPAGSLTARLGILNWNQVLLYPAGRPVRDIPIHASVRLPTSWKCGTALDVETSKDAGVAFKVASLETLVDSPVLFGLHFKEVQLHSPPGPAHYMVLAAESADALKLSAELQGHHEQLIREAGELFGVRHYRSYRFLVALSDHLHPDGVEHHECSENRLPERFLIDESYRKEWYSWLMAHEYVHSWNGKYRRPEGLATTDYQQPMKTRLLWVYEGLTQYLGLVLAARSGLFSAEMNRENLALIADWAEHQKGRTWRSLEDTSISAPFLYSARSDWGSRRRGTDFYDEGVLLWLDVDTQIRTLSQGKKSLDDFCHAFFGGKDGLPEVRPYTLADVIKALDNVVAHHWKDFLDKRVKTTAPEAPLAGLHRSGWKLVYRATASELFKSRDSDDKTINLTSSIGLLLKEEGQVADVIPGMPADKAGIGPGMKLHLIGDRRWSAERLHEAIADTAQGHKLVLVLENQDFSQTYTLDYADGLRYPQLDRTEETADLLDKILHPRSPVQGEQK